MTRIAQTLLASLVAALALCAAATAGAPVLAAGGGCALACIERALVTPTASSATVAVETSVPASVTVRRRPSTWTSASPSDRRRATSSCRPS